MAEPADAYTLHLASVRSAEETEDEWRRLAEEYGLPEGLVAREPERVEVEGKGTFYRVLRGSFASRAEAEAACDAVEAKGAYCAVRERD